MIELLAVLAVCSTLTPAANANDGREAAAHQWPQWRGPLGTGVAPHGKPPVEWSESRNIRWKIALLGSGHSTPIIWDDRVYITAAVPYGDPVEPRYSSARGAHNESPVTHPHKFVVMALSRRDGKILWERTVREQLPYEGGHVTASLASSSPVTDGEHVFACFGSYGVYCLNRDGKVLWEKDLGRMHPLHAHGEGSSPALYGDTLILNWDHEGPSFLVAFDKRSGEERWKVERETASSWSTPIAVEHGGKTQLIVSGSKRLRGYDLASGQVIWECGGLSIENVVASPVAGDGMVYAGSSYDQQAMLAIRLEGATGDITGSKQVVWRRALGAPYVPSPLLYGDALYFVRHFQGVMTRVNARTGQERPGTFRLNGIRGVFASPVGAAERVYITDRNGTTLVIRHADNPEVVASNQLDDNFSASPAVAGSEIYLRGQRNLYCIAEQ